MRDKGLNNWLNWLRRPENKHWLMLLFWPFYASLYYTAQRLIANRAIRTATALDSLIPFCAAFAFPYLLWFPYWGCMLLYAGLREPKLFERMMRYIMLTFSIAGVLYVLIPTTTGLRPEIPKHGFFNALIRLIYTVDYDACACPSEHIVGIFAVLFAVKNSDTLTHPVIKACAAAIGLLIAASTMYTKQHAVMDVLAAIPLSAMGGLLCFDLPRHRAKIATKQAG